VYVFDEATGTIASRAIEIGIANWEYTEIVGGLAAGERVVSSIDRDGVVDGAAVTPE
jgi:HlyD family secretion protein